MGVAVTMSAPGLTREDLDALRPEDGGLRYELLDGAILVTPSPGLRHQSAVLGLAVLLRSVATADHQVVIAPFDVGLAPDTVLQPDILVARKTDLTEKELPAAPVLVVEVLSPSTRRIDEQLKKELYAEARVGSYWIVDPVLPAVTVLELADGRDDYVEVGRVEGQESLRVERPFPVELIPADLPKE